MNTVVTNAFSLNMLALASVIELRMTPLTVQDVREFIQDYPTWISAVGHADTAAVFTEQLGVVVESNRVSVEFTEDTQLVVGQYKGPRLEEGTKTLPEGAVIEWVLVTHS